MTKIWRNLLIAACLLSFVVLLGFFNTTKPRILVLHSAAEDSRWAIEVDRGMRQALEGNRRPVDVEFMYMDVTSPVTARRTEEAVAEARRAIGRVDPDVLIAVDDEANALVARAYVGHASPRILYVSIDRPPKDFGYTDAGNVSGISEQLPYGGVRDAVTAIFPGRTPRLAVIGVDSTTGRAELAQVQAFEWGPIQLGEQELVSTAPKWREAVEQMAGADALLVLTTQDLLDNGAVVTAAELSSWTQQYSRPLPIGTEVGFVESGGGLSFSPPPDYYGEQAIRLALDWLDGRSTPGPPPPVDSAHFEVAIRQGRLAERGIAMAPIYLQAARENGTLYE